MDADPADTSRRVARRDVEEILEVLAEIEVAAKPPERGTYGTRWSVSARTE